MKRDPSFRRRAWLIAAVAVVLIAVTAVALFTSGGGEARLLTRYYTAMYAEGSLEDLAACVIPAEQSEYYSALTDGGTSYRRLAQWRAEALEQVGEHPSVRIRLLDVVRGTSAQLNTLKEQYPDAQEYCVVSFRLVLSGDGGVQRLLGVTEMLRSGGRWYLPSSGITLTPEAETK